MQFAKRSRIASVAKHVMHTHLPSFLVDGRAARAATQE